MREILKRGGISFTISSFAGLVVNMLIDIIVNQAGGREFLSLSPNFVAMFPTPVIAAYVNILLYGVIGAVFAVMTFVSDINRLGFVVQGLIYFLVTGSVCTIITILMWQLHHYPQALLCTLAGYAITYIIMGVIQMKRLKEDIRKINETLMGEFAG